MIHQIVSREGVEGLDPAQASPAEIVTSSVQSDVESVEVSSLPVEEFQQIQVDQDCIDNGTKIESVQLEWSNRKVEDQESPAHHPEPAVCQLLDVDTQQSRVELDTSVELIWERSRLETFTHLGEIMSWLCGI